MKGVLSYDTSACPLFPERTGRRMRSDALLLASILYPKLLQARSKFLEYVIAVQSVFCSPVEMRVSAARTWRSSTSFSSTR
jgi:hypothetical protein